MRRSDHFQHKHTDLTCNRGNARPRARQGTQKNNSSKTYLLKEDGDILLVFLAPLGRLPVGVGGGVAAIVHVRGALLVAEMPLITYCLEVINNENE